MFGRRTVAGSLSASVSAIFAPRHRRQQLPGPSRLGPSTQREGRPGQRPVDPTIDVAWPADWFEDRNISWTVRLRLWLASILFGRTSSYHRGLLLLLENLSPIQRQELLRSGHFHVTGGVTGRRYRISRGRQLNIHQLDEHNRRVCIWCFYPAGNLVEGDVMLAQKLALELFEDEALSAANRLSNYFEPITS